MSYKDIDKELKERAILELIKLREKLEASDRREKSLHKELEHYSKEVFDLRNRIKELTEPMVIKISPRDEAKLKLNAQFGNNFEWNKIKEQIDGISRNLVDDDVNNLPFYTLEYSVDGQQESLINLSLHDCEELYGQIIGSLEYFKITKQKKFIEDVYSVWGDGIHIIKDASSHQEVIDKIMADGRMHQISKFSFYKNGKMFHEMTGNRFIHTKIKHILKELEDNESLISNDDQMTVDKISDGFTAYGTMIDGSILFFGSFMKLNNLVNDLIMNPHFKKVKETRFYKNGKRFAVLNGGLNLFCTVNDIKDELSRLEKEIDKND